MTIAGAASGLPARAQATDDVSSHFGVWRNPKDSVHVEIKSCGANACGYVVWANAKAQADARKGGTGNLIGLQILRGFTPEKNGTWRGKVFIPDLNMTFAGTAEFIDATTMKARGCFLANILCKSQTWRRVDAAPG
jgi:uncharacterized protein (DUF2147 family)